MRKLVIAVLMLFGFLAGCANQAPMGEHEDRGWSSTEY
jgi:hypothetical protein